MVLGLRVGFACGSFGGSMSGVEVVIVFGLWMA